MVAWASAKLGLAPHVSRIFHSGRAGPLVNAIGEAERDVSSLDLFASN